MARHLDKDPATYTKERDGFVRDLHHFHDTRGTPFRRPPIIGGQEVDLFLLYSLVTQNGGWMKVNSKNGWHELLEKFDLPNKCVNGGIALKQIYIRFLDRYEKFHFLGEEAERGSDDDDESRHKRWSARALHSVSLNYNYHQHNIAEASRAYNGLSTTLHKQSDYDRLALSLISPLPNEQDFAVNVCTLMCNEGKHTLRLDKCPRLIDYLLAHTGVFNHVSLRTVFTEVYTTVRKHPLNHFWYDVVESKDFLDLINENNFSDEKKKSSKPISPPSKWRTKNNNNKIIINGKEETKTGFVNEENRTEDDSSGVNVNVELKSQSTNESGDKQNRIVISDDGSDSELFASETPVKLKIDVEDKYLFCTGSSLGTQDFVGQRVLQIANILRNLSFTEDNVTVLATNRTFLRFLLLCVSSRWNSIHQLGLDMLGNIAAEIILKDQSERLTDYLIKFVTDGLHSPDRVIILACLEILNKLSQREANEDYMLRVLEKKCYSQVCSFLTLHDVMLLIYTLECLYSLSSLGERACNFIVEVHGIIDTLVSLVTVEGKSYGPKACIGMKLVETVPGITTSQPTQIQQVSTPQQHQQQNTLMPVLQQQPLLIATSSSSTVHITTTPARPAQPIQARNIVVAQHKHTTQTHTTPVKQTTTSAQSSTPSSAQHVLQQQHAHQQAIQENEQFALAWLRATYEPCGHGRIEQQELYKQYLNSCTKIGRRGVIAPLHFPRCVRSVFGGTVGPNQVKNTDPPNNNLLFYEGIRPRIVPLIITLPSAALQQTVQHTKATAAAQRRKPPAVPIVAPVVAVVDAANAENQIPNSPASPILKAQLSAPPKQRESPTKPDNKSQVLAHPHLSQALLGTGTNTSPAKDTSSTATSCSTASTSSGAGLATSSAGQSSSSSLIKSLLATKVNDCMLTPHAASSIKPPAAAAALPATDAIVQVAQRQQRLLAQQNQPAQQITPTTIVTPQKKIEIKPKNIRMNGIRLSDAESSLGSDTVSSTSSQHAENHYQPPPAAVVSGIGTNSTLRGRREPPQPPPPPLAPLSTSVRAKTPRMDIEDSNSTGNNSVAVSSTEDGDNSLTSFEGILLNGIPHSVDIDAPYTEDSNSKDSIKNIKSKPLMLADLLEKKVEKDPPILNGMLCKELRIGEKGLELVDNHINKVLSKDNSNNISELLDKSTSSVNNNSDDLKIGGVKRSAEDDISEVETKKLNTGITESVAPNSVNGVDSPKPESIDSNGDDPNNASVSATAANLYASLAADVLEDEDEELLMQQEETPVVSTMPIIVDESTQHIQQTQQQLQVVQGTPMHQVIVTPHGQGGEQLIMAQRQIIVSQGQIQPSTQQLLFTTGGQFTTQTTATIKTPTGHQTVLVQTPTTSSNNQQQRPQQMVISQAGGPPIHLVQHGGQMQQVQLVQTGGTGQPQTVMIQTPGTGMGNANQTQYVIAAQQQTALVQGQPQTVLVAQTPQQHGTPTKTIIILQSQPQVSNTATHHQKVVVTPQGQPVVVTQVQRPLLQSSSVSNNIPPGMMMTNAQVIQTTANAVQKPTQATVITQNLNVTSPPSTPKSMGKPGSRPQTPIADAQTANGNKTTPTGQTSPLPPPLPPPPIIKDINHPWVCEWRGCTSTRKFRSANEVYMHACEIHCSPTLNPGDELQCLWDRCDTLKRKRFSLMTHLHDRHCSPDIMKAMAVRRRQLSQAGKTEISTPAPPPPHPGYAPDAALHAIKRHALEFVNPKELQDDNEGPVTKSIRLTASLILRNLVIFSNSSRRYLRHYEPHLAGVALSNVESSRTIAQLLYDLSDTSASRR